MPGKRYRAILMDPPWAFETWGGKMKAPTVGADPYDVLTLDELKLIPVGDLAERDCALIMWVIDSHIEQAIELARHWGFAFKTKVLVWNKLTKDGSKRRMGMGRWTRKEQEIALMFTRGKPRRLSGGVRETIDAPVREHSRKPDEQYERIEKLVAGPYLEMFSRTSALGWDCWGNQAGRFDLIADAA